jgi:hypothetical protein
MTRLRGARARGAALEVGRFTKEHGVPPTYLQLAAMLHCGERMAYYRAADAEKLGLLVRDHGMWPVERVGVA